MTYFWNHFIQEAKNWLHVQIASVTQRFEIIPYYEVQFRKLHYGFLVLWAHSVDTD